MTMRDPRVFDIDWYIDMRTFERLDLDPPYQRFSVWSLGYKQYFIDTIINGYPSPAIFLHKENISNTHHVYHVVDGKQRLTSIFEFLDDELSLQRDHDQYAGATYSDLPPDIQRMFGNYKIITEILSTRDAVYLRETFDRLNRNVKKLNSQELRHARYDGAFITLMTTLAEDRFWQEINVSNKARVRSMRDVEYVSEIFLLTMHGVQDSIPRNLDKHYALYDDKENFEGAEEARNRYDSCLNIMRYLRVDFLKDTRYNNLNDFYSLWAALLEFVNPPAHIDNEETRNQLREFDERVTIPEDIDPEDQIALRYSDAVRQGANKANNRQIRADILRDFIVVR